MTRWPFILLILKTAFSIFLYQIPPNKLLMSLLHTSLQSQPSSPVALKSTEHVSNSAKKLPTKSSISGHNSDPRHQILQSLHQFPPYPFITSTLNPILID